MVHGLMGSLVLRFMSSLLEVRGIYSSKMPGRGGIIFVP